MVLIGNWLFALISLFSFCVAAAPKVQATVDSNNVDLGQVVEFSISVSSDSQMSVGDLRLPQLDGFDLLNSSQQSRHSIINGEVRISQSFVYLLQANKPGKLVIPSVEVVVNGEPYKTNEINMTVSKTAVGRGQQRPQARQAPSDEEDDPLFDDGESLFEQLLRRQGLNGRRGPQPKINPDEAFFIQLEADKNEAYVGEQITATWYLYTRNAIQNIDTLKYPNLRSFIKEDIEVATRLDWQQEVINGIPYRKALLVSYALFPMKEGTSIIDSYKARCTVSVGGGPFGMGQSYTFTKASQEIKVKVKPIPTQGRPADYSGGVGQFQFKASIDNPNVNTNQPFSFKLRFEGRGNAKSIDLPSLDLPKSLEIYSQRDETKFNKDGTSYKEFELLLIPREPGKITIPKISASFFNPSGSFYSASTEPIALNVGGAKGSNVPSVNPKAEFEDAPKKQSMPTPIVEWESYKSRSIWQDLLGWFVVFGLITLFIIWRLFVELAIGAKKKSVSVQMQKRLKTVQNHINKSEWRKVGSELTNTIYVVVGTLSGEEGGASVELGKIFSHISPSLRREFEAPIQKMLSRCETLSFAPEAVVGSMKDPTELQKLKTETETLLNKFIKAASE